MTTEVKDPREPDTSLEGARLALASVKARAKEGRKTPGGHVRVGEFWYGDPGEESALIFRQGSRVQLKALEALESSPAAERAAANKKTVAACVLWFNGATTESKIEDVVAFVDDLEELYPLIWGELIGAWDRHNHAAREDLRGKA